MKRRHVKIVHRLMLVVAALPMLQVGGCASEFIASAIANETGLRVAETLSYSLETVLLNMFQA